MTALDTNVVSELAKESPDSAVLDWLDQLPRESRYITSITQAEILRGIGVLPDGRKKQQLLNSMRTALAENFRGRVLPFDHRAAEEFAVIWVSRTREGRPISMADAMIAAICRSVGATIATRDVGGFENCGIRIVNPWDYSPPRPEALRL